MRLAVAAALAGILAAPAAHALRAGQPLPGFTCAALAVPDNADPRLVQMPPVFDRPGGRRVGLAGGTVLLSPKPPVKGYVQLLQPNGTYVWIGADKLKPWHSLSNPRAVCIPSVMSDGMPGATYAGQ
ncbi:MAG: hypothetical protein NVSMB51_22010 [Solirubrobacteraceae bacterium]